MDDTRTLCFQHADQPRLFHYCTTAGASPNCYVRNEVRSVISGDFSAPIQRYRAIGDILGLIGMAEQGDLDSKEQSKPIVSAPPIWELRWLIHGIPYRLYYTGTLNRKPELVGLRFTRKRIGSNTDETNEMQNQDAAIAQERYNSASSYNWGHYTKRKRCEYCYVNNINDLTI